MVMRASTAELSEDSYGVTFSIFRYRVRCTPRFEARRLENLNSGERTYLLGDHDEGFVFELPCRRNIGCFGYDLGHRDGYHRGSLDNARTCAPQLIGLGVPLPLRHLLSPTSGN